MVYEHVQYGSYTNIVVMTSYDIIYHIIVLIISSSTLLNINTRGS